jgi:2-methylcitrate dehydratase PrpD
MWTFTDEAVRRPAIAALYPQILAHEVDAIGADDPLLKTRAAGDRGFAEVEVCTVDGRRESIQVSAAPGHPTRELSWRDIEQKFMDCAEHSPISQANAERALNELRHLNDVRDVRTIVDLLVLTGGSTP